MTYTKPSLQRLGSLAELTLTSPSPGNGPGGPGGGFDPCEIIPFLCFPEFD